MVRGEEKEEVLVSNTSRLLGNDVASSLGYRLSLAW